MNKLILIALLLLSQRAVAQGTVTAEADTSDVRVRTAIRFLQTYLSSFGGLRTPDYSRYWCSADCRRSALPDDMVYSIADSYPTYRFGGNTPSIFYVQPFAGYVHLKTLFASADTNGQIMLWAITNHYVRTDSSGGRPEFVSELELHAGSYRQITNGNITYHFPASITFNKEVSDKMLVRLKDVEQKWGFAPIPIHYYFAANAADLARMRGMDFCFAMDKPGPAGISYPERRKIFCQGLGEGYLHEVLHLYFNPLYGKSPICHGLVYYLAGSVGKDFDWFAQKMNDYITTHPDADLANFDNLKLPDMYADNIIAGLLCSMIDKKDGVAGLRRALRYETIQELARKEFGVAENEFSDFLKASFRNYQFRHE